MTTPKIGSAVLMVSGPAAGNGGLIEQYAPGIYHGCEWLISFEKEVPCYKDFGMGTDRKVWSLRPQFIVISPPGDSLLKEDEAPASAAAVHRPAHAGFPTPEKV